MTANAAADGERPPRNIVVLSDGTGNSAAALFRTNVWKLYKALDLRDPQDPEVPRQFAFYDDGVGTSSLWPLQMLGGIFGVGLARNVRELYAFVCRTYRPGDKIHAFGFSRGAFTVRVLCGLILREGLVPYDGDEAKLQRDVAAAYRSYRAARSPKDGKPRFRTLTGIEILGRALRDRMVSVRDRCMGYDPYEVTRARMTIPPGIAFVGVWDTVAAYGLPIHELTVAVDKLLWPLSMPDNDLSPKVDRAMHALSLDDERRSFHPELWNEGAPRNDPGAPAPNAGRPTGRIEQERLSQVWFAGVHSDLGGGYPDDAASYAALKWIMDGACREGLRFSRRARAEYAASSDENGVIHNSRSGLSGYYRYAPRRLDQLAKPQRTEGCGRRVAIDRVKIHESALRRIRVGQDGYAPIAIPPRFDVVRIDNEVVAGESYLDGDAGPGEYDPHCFGREREHVYDLVWRRRAAYFWTLGATLILVALPLFASPNPEGACLEWPCFAAPLLTPVKAVAPALLAPWLDAFSSAPRAFTIILAAAALGLWRGARLEGRIRDRMRAVWALAPGAAPCSGAAFGPPPPPSRFMMAVQRLRLSKGYRLAMRRLTRVVLPGAAFAIAAALAVMLAIKSVHEIRSSAGCVCRSATASGEARGVEAGAPALFDFDPRQICQPTGVRVDEGATYRLRFDIPHDAQWRDGDIPAGPQGVDPGYWKSRLISLFTPLRRHWREAWFQPVARVGGIGNDSYVLRPAPSIAPVYAGTQPPSSGDRPDERPRTVFAADIVARSTGELFLYVNDAVGLPQFYKNNTGAARVSIERVVPAPPERAPAPPR